MLYMIYHEVFMDIKNIKNHFNTITSHKLLVMKYCFAVGLYKQGLLHDLSKYLPSEFIMGCRYYQGNRSPNNAEREDTGVSTAWLHHKGRNKHHYEYWLDYGLNFKKDGMIVGSYMPVKYVVEMFCDRIAASRIYNKNNFTEQMPLEYYKKGNPGAMIHHLSRDLLEKMLIMYAKKGETETLKYIRKKIVPNAEMIDKENKKIIKQEIKK